MEVHGTAREVMCIGHDPRHGTPAGCGWRAPVAWAFDQVDAGDTDPLCPLCGGLVKSATVSFGQMLFPRAVEAAYGAGRVGRPDARGGVVAAVYPAADLPLVAVRTARAW